MRFENGEEGATCYEATAEIIEGEAPTDPGWIRRHPPSRKLTVGEVAALKALFGNGAIYLHEFFGHKDDGPETASAIDLLMRKRAMHFGDKDQEPNAGGGRIGDHS